MNVTITGIAAENIYKYFHIRKVLNGISFTVETGQSVVITGPNGSGKSTLIKILTGLLTPTRGQVVYFHPDGRSKPQALTRGIGLVAPYLQLYPDLTADEHIDFFGKMRGIASPLSKGRKLMDQFGLRGRGADLIKTYSSGMLHRMKYVLALLHEPHVLFVDEPSANLDEEGKVTVYEIIQSYKNDHIVIIATNEPEEIRLGDIRVDVTAQ